MIEIYHVKDMSGNEHVWFLGALTKENYDQFVTDLEAKARELWPEKFEPKKIVCPKCHGDDGEYIKTANGYKCAYTDCQHEWVNIEREDGLTDTITVAEHEAIREQDRLNRERQIPIGSRRG